jgi:hypothetical protein
MATQQMEDSKQKSAPLRLPKLARWLREILALLVWGLAVAQLFVVDVGIISRAIPLVEPILRYRLLVVLGCLAIPWLILGNRVFLLFFGYIVVYPFVVVLWIIPKFAFRNWAVAIAFSPAIYSIITTFRVRFALFTMALIASFAICLAEERLVISLCMVLLALYLIVHFISRFRVAFSPSTVFADVGGAVRKVWDKTRTARWATRPEGDPNSEEYRQQFGQRLLQMYVITTAFSFLAARLKEVIESRKLDLYFLGSLVYTFMLTTLVFAIEYFGLERLRPKSFVGIDSPTLLDFIGFSFSTLMTSDISPLRPTNSGIAQLLSYLQLFSSLLIIVLLVFVVLASIRERYRQDLSEVVKEVSAVGDRAAALIQANYALTIAAAEAWLLEHQRPLTKWLLRLRYGEQHAKEIPGYSDPTAQPGITKDG